METSAPIGAWQLNGASSLLMKLWQTDRPTARRTDRIIGKFHFYLLSMLCGLLRRVRRNTLMHYKKHYLKLHKTSLVNNVWRETWIMTQKTAAQNAVSLWGNQTIKGSPSKFSSILLNLNINNQYKLFFLFNLLQVFLLYYSPIIY